MEKKINTNNFVEKQLIETYQSINGLDVIEEFLLFKGVDFVGEAKTISRKFLDDMALVHYNLKVNATNRLYVGMHLDRFYQRECLVCNSGRVNYQQPKGSWLLERGA